MQWVSEAADLPKIAQPVLVAFPRQLGDFWDLKVAQVLVRHEDVSPRPVQPGSRWPTDYYWSTVGGKDDHTLITGNAWWAMLDTIPLPLGAWHKHERGFHYITQPDSVWIPQSK